MSGLIDRKLKLRWRRKLRNKRQQVEGIGIQAEEHFERHFVKRLERLVPVRRFVIGWSLLVGLTIAGLIFQATSLAQYYHVTKPVPGGIYTEGIVGSFTDANPIYAAGSVDSAVSRLLFAGLLKYDAQNRLIGDLAQSWSADERGSVYTVRLKPGLKWHDGAPLTSADVVYTYQTIQNPDAKSPYYGSWQGVVIAATDSLTVTFTLPSALVSFPYSLTGGIVPRHILSPTPAAQLRSVRFNTDNPVGAGPFKLEAVEVKGETPETRQEQIALTPNPDYHAGMPKLQRFIVRTFIDEKALIASFQRHELTAISGLDIMPEQLAQDVGVHEYATPLTGQVGSFFRTTHPILNDQKVRQALVQSVDQLQIIRGLGYPVIASDAPFLAAQFPYNKAATQLPYDVNQANALLESAGWKMGADGLRAKNGEQLAFQLYSQTTSEYTYISQQLQSYWRKVGVNASVILQSDMDLQSTVNRNGYDVLLYGITIGVDPDVYAYWHSSQAASISVNRFNFSKYASSVADKALEAGRTRSDPTLRTVKYRPFLDAWRADAPAFMLYQPRYLYIADREVFGLSLKMINEPTDRYKNVENWMIRTTKVTN